MKKHIRNFLLLSTLTSISIYIINKAISISSNAKNFLKTEKGNFFSWRYGNIFYTKQGKGKPLFLIHDLNPASSSYEWDKIEKHLAKHHTVYSIDLLGCGRSDKPNMTYSNYLFVQLITDFIKNIIGEKPDIITTGESSSFTIMACNMEPEYFDKILVINPANLAKLCKTPNKRKNALKFLIDLPVFGTMIYNLVFAKNNIDHLFSQDYFYKSHMVPTRTIDTYYESAHMNHSYGKYLLSSIKSNYTNISIIHALKKINNSIYLIGSRNNEESEKIINSYLSHNPSIEFSYVSESKYLPQMEVPEKLLEILNLYLNPVK
ncbi:MAG: alpha/beta hydrolase [Lachnospiraceae bacterium]|nr:alpha/beta hydrolase [Lachnospiraceae bacterium]